jgi:apolipoprotein D and lipocalin family protein
MKKEVLATTAVLGVVVIAALLLLHEQDEDLETVKYVELDRFLGKWYEIAAFPQKFEKDCSHTSAEYSLNKNGTLHVKNSCIKDGKINIVEGKAFVSDTITNAKLSVQFFWPFRGEYWIIGLAHDYSYAVVGHPSRDYLWILGREPKMDAQTYRYVLALAAYKGFDVRKLVMTKQS